MTDLVALKDLSVDLAQHVQKQGELINVAEENVNAAVDDTDAAVTDLYKVTSLYSLLKFL